jgi:hypothetical protein
MPYAVSILGNLRQIQTPLPFLSKISPLRALDFPLVTRHFSIPTAIIPRMTLLEITYELHSTLSHEQLQRLGEFANLYGLRRFHVDDSGKTLTFEYDASRLRETQVAHALGQAGIPIIQRQGSATSTDPLPVEKASLPR